MRQMTKTNASQYLIDMVNDGWTFQPIFGDSGYLKGTKENFVCHLDIRDTASNDFDDTIGRISIWDNKDLFVEPPYPKYNWEQTKKNALKCDFCGGYVDKIYKVAFANKACKNCVDDAKKVMEIDGWYD